MKFFHVHVMQLIFPGLSYSDNVNYLPLKPICLVNIIYLLLKDNYKCIISRLISFIKYLTDLDFRFDIWSSFSIKHNSFKDKFMNIFVLILPQLKDLNLSGEIYLEGSYTNIKSETLSITLFSPF